MLADGAVFLDVREDREVAHCRIEPSVHIPLRQVPARAESELDSSQEIVVYCHMGVRSLRAAETLLSLGFDRVYNLAGGIDAWSLQVDPSVPRY